MLPAISLAHVQQELDDADGLIEGLRLELDTSGLSAGDLRFAVSGRSRIDGELYVVEFLCDDYREMPPYVEMLDPESGERGTAHAYADCFHRRPCICATYNRKAYGEHSGLHGKWRYGDWSNEAETNHLGGMISHIWSHIHGYQGGYTGRRK